MGMAASQARYLELTARKTDVEYQGQQINQQRTELANESAGLFQKLMTLTVPTAPSSTDYTSTAYTFNNGANDCTIQDGGVTTLTGDPQYNANVTYSYTNSVYTGIDNTRTDLTAYKYGSEYWLGTTKLTAATYTPKSASSSSTTTTDDTTAIAQIYNDVPTSDVAKIYNGATGTIYKYTSGKNTYYVSSNQLDTMLSNGGTGTLDNCYAANIDKTTTTTDKAYVSKASSGRYNSIQLAGTGSTTFDLTATTSTNNNAYNDAMNEYNYQEESYQQQVTQINSKTSVIQLQDKNLELQLRQLDTEQKALSTELDSVKKVIDKNIESTFKTFSS